MNARQDYIAPNLHRIIQQAIQMRRQHDADGALEFLTSREHFFREADERFSWLVASGDCLKTLKRDSEAITAFMQAVDLRPDSILARTSLASLYVLRGRLSEGEAEYNVILKQDAANPYALTGLARIYKQTGRSGKAREHYQTLLQNPSLPAQIMNEAENYLLPSVKPAPMFKTVAAFADAGAPAAAPEPSPPADTPKLSPLEAQLAKVAAAPRDVGARHVLATILLREGRHDDAIEQWQTVLQVDTTNFQARQKLDQLGAPYKRSAVPLPAPAPAASRVFRIESAPAAAPAPVQPAVAPGQVQPHGLIEVDEYDVIVSVDRQEVGRMSFRLPVDSGSEQEDNRISDMVNLIFATTLSATLTNTERGVSRRVVATEDLSPVRRRICEESNPKVK